MKKRILLAEDDFIIAEMIKRQLNSLGCRDVTVVHNAKETLDKVDEIHPDIVILDINMEYKSAGIDACKTIKKDNPRQKVFFLTAYSRESFKSELKDVQYDGYLNKTNFKEELNGIL